MSGDVACTLCAAGSVVLLAWMDAALIVPRDKRLLRMGLVSAVPVGLLAGGNLLLKPFNLAQPAGRADGRHWHSMPCGRADWDSSEGADLPHGGALSGRTGCHPNHRTGRSG